MAFQFRQLKYLCTLAETGNYHTAAERLYITQPTLSLAIKKLEASLGHPLFLRRAGGLVPTDTGKIVLEYAQKILQLDEELDSKLDVLHNPVTRTLHIGTYQIFYSMLLPPVIAKFQLSHLNVGITSQHSTYRILESDLLNRKLDVILCIPDKPHPAFDSIPLRQSHPLAALPANHPACKKAVALPGQAYPYLDIRVLNGETAYLQYPHQQMRWQENKLMETGGFRPGEIRETDSIDLAVRLASEGLGVAFTMDSYLKTLHLSKPVRFFIVGNLEQTSWLTLCTLKNRSQEPLIRELIRIFKEQIEEL